MDPRETADKPGPVRTSSGTRVAMRITTLEPDVAWQRGANDLHDMPTRELDLDEVRAMALRCASDIGPAERAHPPVPPAAEPSRPRLQLVLHEDEPPSSAMDVDPLEGQVGRSRRSWALALVVVLIVLATATAAAFEVYGVLP